MKTSNNTLKARSIFKLILPLVFLLPLAPGVSAQAYTQTEQACFNEIQDKVAYDQQGNNHWNEANIRNLCKGAATATGPVACFKFRMPTSGWANAIKECT